MSLKIKMLIMKRAFILIFSVLFIFFAGAQDMSGVKIHINPGHGGWDAGGGGAVARGGAVVGGAVAAAERVTVSAAPAEVLEGHDADGADPAGRADHVAAERAAGRETARCLPRQGPWTG